ncbi:hypothetical protein [Marilutibacter chinensis]|uniref:Uncharacterized protein n=1 Tax=Marilutibacter chinensis TaxID=2912247 RepID=A0ABS9HSI4_9GAMM|nr:hypothetical protein [Lysobacter chinensis]MCF7221307.1 hypothetical protein [Lysobacter chinensis]
MKRTLSMAAMALLVAACGEAPVPPPSETETGATAATSAPAPPRTNMPAIPKMLEQPLPHSVGMPLEYNLRTDSETGRRRKIGLDYLKVTQTQALDAMTAALQAEHYTIVQARNGEDGSVTRLFQHPDGTRLTMTVTRRKGSNTSHLPDARGRIVFDFRFPERKTAGN